MSSNGFCHVPPRLWARRTELLYHIADFQGIFIRKARQRSKGVKRSIVVDELHIEFGIPLWQRTSHFIPGPLFEEEHPDLSQSRVSSLKQDPPSEGVDHSNHPHIRGPNLHRQDTT